MLRVLQRICSWGGGRRRSERSGRKGSARLHYERLESRQLLFAASVIEELPDWQEPLEIEPIYARPVDVSLEVRLGGGMLGGRSGERWSLAPLPTIPKDGWYDVPSLPSDGIPSGPPPAEYPDDSSLDELIDIGGAGATEFFGPATQASPHTKGVPDREAQEVLALLAALQYMPRVTTTGEDTLEVLAADVAQLADITTAQSTAGQNTRAGGAVLPLVKRDGGMVALPSESRSTEKPGAMDAVSSREEAGDAEALLQEDRQRVEELQTRYQAFEVSAIEAVPGRTDEVSAEAPSEDVPGVATEGGTGAGASEPVAGGGPVDAPSEGAPQRGDVGYGNRHRVTAGDDEGKPGSGSLVPAEPSAIAASPVLRAAAAFAFLLYTSRTARSADVKEPERNARDVLKELRRGQE